MVAVKRDFLALRLPHDCRCLLQFIKEAEVMWESLGYASADDLIKNGYKLDPYEVRLAVEWLEIRDPDEAVGFKDVVVAAKKAWSEKYRTPGGANNPTGNNQYQRKEVNVDNVNIDQDTLERGGNRASYLLRRMAKTRPEILDRYEAGEFPSVRQAAIEAGFIKVPTMLDILKKTWKKATNDERCAFLAYINE